MTRPARLGPARGVRRAYVEGGPELASAVVVAAGLADELAIDGVIGGAAAIFDVPVAERLARAL